MEKITTERQVLLDALDQLDLALDQLLLRDRNFDRFALMLIDNVVELILHMHALDCKRDNEYHERFGELRYDKRAVTDAVQQKFGPKVLLAEKVGLISSVEADSFRHLHGFRNVAYHQGIRQAGVLHSVASFYLRIACEMLTKYSPRSMMSSNGDIIPVRAQKYLGARADYSVSIDAIQGAFARLAKLLQNTANKRLSAT